MADTTAPQSPVAPPAIPKADPERSVGDVLVAQGALSADLVPAKIGASLRPDPNVKLIDRPAFAILQLDDVKVTSILIDLEDQCDTMMQVF